MAKRTPEESDFVVARRFLVGVTIFAAFIGAMIASRAAGGTDDHPAMVSGIIGFLATTVLYPLVGALVSRLCVALRIWAYNGTEEPIGKAGLTGLAAVWPAAFCYAIIVYPCVGIIHRMF